MLEHVEWLGRYHVFPYTYLLFLPVCATMLVLFLHELIGRLSGDSKLLCRPNRILNTIAKDLSAK